jgi:hypothetical protein
MIPTLPLRLRNRLAETILRALHDPAARRQLERLATDPATAAHWLEDATREQGPLLRERARRASEALAGRPSIGAEPSLDEAVAAAATLFDAGLHFEVHELLEPHWVRAEGPEREALQGLIQIAVGYQHLANGNLQGARALLTEGPRRLRAGDLPGLDLATFAAAVSDTIPWLTNDPPPTVPPFPRRSRVHCKTST